MKKLIMLCAICILIMSKTSIAEESQRIISIQGSASVATVPDAFSVTFVIEEKGKTVSALNQQVTKATRSIIAFLRQMNVEERNIETMQIQLNPWYENIQRERIQQGFVLRRTIKISHSELEQYDSLIDGVLSNGANRIEQFSFIVSNQQKLYRQALSEAMLDAKDKAQRLLSPVGGKLGALVSVSEHQNYSPQPKGRMMMADAELSTALPGMQGVSASVSVSFLIE